MSYRIAVGGFQHETNTFAPLPTPYANFVTGGSWPPLTEGAAILETFPGLNLPISGFIDADSGFDLVPLVWAATEPNGFVTADAFDRISDTLISRLLDAGPVDALYLDLHGAMVPEGFDDGEAELLNRIRSAVGPDLPIAVSLDLHGNTSRTFFELASVVTIYRTYPHIDMAETGARAASLLKTRLDHGAPLHSAWRQLDYIIPIVAQPTMRQPGGRLYGMLPGLEGDGVASVDFAFGFPPADIPDVGATVFAYGTDQAAVDAAADAMLSALRDAEDQFRDPMTEAGETVRRAMAIAAEADKPVIIADPQDNPGAGAPGDSTGLLQALIEAKAQNACIGMIWDPDAAAAAHAAGVGAEIDVEIGGQFPESGGPAVACRVRVEALSDGNFTFTGPMFGGLKGALGPMAALRVIDPACGLEIAVGTRRCQNLDQAIFRAVGIEPEEKAIVAVKSAIHFMADYEPISADVLFAEAPGANPCRIERIPYTRLRPGVRLGPHGPVSGD